MNYKIWNLRGISLFKEEIIISNEKNISDEFPSIRNFRENNIYSSEVRDRLCSYLQSCPIIISTSYERLNAYTCEPISTLTYFTDGEFIFTNLLQDYIYYDDFVLPQRWYELIKMRNYINANFDLDYEKILSGDVDIFENFKRSFADNSIVKNAFL